MENGPCEFWGLTSWDGINNSGRVKKMSYHVAMSMFSCTCQGQLIGWIRHVAFNSTSLHSFRNFILVAIATHRSLLHVLHHCSWLNGHLYALGVSWCWRTSALGSQEFVLFHFVLIGYVSRQKEHRFVRKDVWFKQIGNAPWIARGTRILSSIQIWLYQFNDLRGGV